MYCIRHPKLSAGTNLSAGQRQVTWRQAADKVEYKKTRQDSKGNCIKIFHRKMELDYMRTNNQNIYLM